MFNSLRRLIEVFRRKITPTKALLGEIDRGKIANPLDVQAAQVDFRNAQAAEAKRRTKKQAEKEAEKAHDLKADELHESLREHAAVFEIRPIEGLSTEVIEIRGDKARVGQADINPVYTVTSQRKKTAIKGLSDAASRLPAGELAKLGRFLRAKQNDSAHSDVSSELTRAISHIKTLFEKKQSRRPR